MIPKIIHYCWFGRNPLPKSALKCMDSWKKFFTDYEIKEWNEDNFNVNINQYTKEAYSLKKYAFVSDYARFWILYNYGGVYFDTDVEIIKSLEDIVMKGPFMGIEKNTMINESKDNPSMIAPGLGLSAFSGMKEYKDILDYYDSMSFLDNNGQIIPQTVVHHTTNIMKKYGFDYKNRMQTCGAITIYPSEFFCPMDSTTGIVKCTENTYTIHHYSCSWINHNTLKFKIHLLKMFFIKITGEFGLKILSFVKKQH